MKQLNESALRIREDSKMGVGTHTSSLVARLERETSVKRPKAAPSARNVCYLLKYGRYAGASERAESSHKETSMAGYVDGIDTKVDVGSITFTR